MLKIYVGSEIEVLNLCDVGDDRLSEEVRQFIESRGCRMIEVWWGQRFSEETLEKLNEVNALSEKNDVYGFSGEDWHCFVIVPRNYVVIVGEDPGQVRPEYMVSATQQATKYLKELASFMRGVKRRVKMIRGRSCYNVYTKSSKSWMRGWRRRAIFPREKISFLWDRIRAPHLFLTYGRNIFKYTKV